jgi:uncharacterized LabA/DUF88 family protein
MASSSDNISMAVFCDFENVALGVRDANYEKFDIQPVLERLLLKGSIVVKKAYCDWERYKGFKAAMHESNFELIEIPHVRQSGKNSADIRLVVDALDLCYTKSHVNTFVIISGDSDFSPLVSKLRENNKHVIAVGVKQSTSDLLVANCDEFIFYDDLVREVKRTVAKREERKARPPAEKRPATDESNRRKEELEARKALAVEMVVETFDALVSERGDSGKIWASLLKDTLKRRRPEFNESYFGFSTFGKLLEEAQSRGLLEFGRDEKSGAYVYRSQNAAPVIAADTGADEPVDVAVDASDMDAQSVDAMPAPVRNNRPPQQERPRSRTSFRTPIVNTTPVDEASDDDTQPVAEEQPQPQPQSARQQNPRGRNRGRDRDRKPAEAQGETPAAQPKPQNQPKQKEARGRGRGRNGDRLPVDPNRERTPSEAQPKSHENALPPELRGRGRNRGPRNQNGVPYPEADAERAFHEQQQKLEAAAAAAGLLEEPVSAPEPATVEEVLGQVDAAAPGAEVKPGASERRRAPRKTAAQKAADAAVVEPVATAEPAAPATIDALPDAVPVAKPARKPAARKTAAKQQPMEAPAEQPVEEVVAEVAAKPARARRPAKPKAEQA